MPIERAKNTNVVVLTKTPVKINSVQAKRSDQTFFTNVINFTLSDKTVTLRKSFDEIKVDYTDDTPVQYNPKVAKAVLNSGLGNFLKSNDTNEFASASFNSQLERLAVEATTIGESLGTDLAGFVSLSEDVFENTGGNDEPIVAEMTAGVPNISILKTSNQKSQIATLTGKSSGDGLLNVVITTGNPKGQKQVLEVVMNAKESQIDAVIKQTSTVNEKVVSASKKDISVNVAAEAQKINKKITRDLGNPVQSNTNANFGSLGTSFSNILGAVIGQIQSTGTTSKVGIPVPSIAEGVQVPEGFPAPPNIIDSDGVSNISSVVEKPALTSSNIGPTDKPFVLSSAGADFTGSLLGNATNYVFETVDTTQELELELRTMTREVTATIVNWTQTHSNVFLDANLVHRVELGRDLTLFGNQQIFNEGIDAGIQHHYVIMKDGTIQRGRPVNIIAGERTPFRRYGIHVIFVAGFNIPEPTDGNADAFDERFLSSDSITPEQWKSFDQYLETYFKVFPGGEVLGRSDVDPGGIAEFATGPGFDVRTYVQGKFDKSTVYTNPADRTEAFSPSEAVNQVPLETAKPSKKPVAEVPSVKEVLKVKDEVIDTSTGKFKLPTQEELDTAASEFESKSIEAGILSRDQVTFATDTIKGFDLGGAERLLKTAQNNDLLSSLNTVIDDIDKNRAKLINNGYSFDEATQSWSKK